MEINDQRSLYSFCLCVNSHVLIINSFQQEHPTALYAAHAHSRVTGIINNF